MEGIEVRHSKKTDSMNVLMRDGSARRVPRETAEQLLKQGQAKRYISNTVYRALALGIEVKDPGTRDEDGVLRDKIRAAKVREEKKRKKDDVKRQKEELELLDEDAA